MAYLEGFPARHPTGPSQVQNISDHEARSGRQLVALGPPVKSGKVAIKLLLVALKVLAHDGQHLAHCLRDMGHA